eukprot:6199140-Pleurochrysis_carterae.AAC.2
MEYRSPLLVTVCESCAIPSACVVGPKRAKIAKDDLHAPARLGPDGKCEGAAAVVLLEGSMADCLLPAVPTFDQPSISDAT